MIEFIGIVIVIVLGAVFIGSLVALAFDIREDCEDASYVLPPSAVDDEIARWQQASERTFARQGIRRNR